MNRIVLVLIIIMMCRISFAQNENSETKIWGGLVLGVIPGFGVGHAVQGRWKSEGWFLTAGESLGFILMASSMGDCDSSNTSCKDRKSLLNSIGSLTYAGFHIYEIVDQAIYAHSHSKQFKKQSRIEINVIPIVNGGYAFARYSF